MMKGLQNGVAHLFIFPFMAPFGLICERLDVSWDAFMYFGSQRQRSTFLSFPSRSEFFSGHRCRISFNTRVAQQLLKKKEERDTLCFGGTRELQPQRLGPPHDWYQTTAALMITPP